MRTIRTTAFLGLAVSAVLLGGWGGYVVSLAFRSNQDSPDSTYFVVGGLGLAASGLLLWGALFVLSPSIAREKTLRLFIEVALILAVLPYAALIGGIGYVLNGALATVAFGFIVVYRRSRREEAA